MLLGTQSISTANFLETVVYGGSREGRRDSAHGSAKNIQPAGAATTAAMAGLDEFAMVATREERLIPAFAPPSEEEMTARMARACAFAMG